MKEFMVFMCVLFSAAMIFVGGFAVGRSLGFSEGRTNTIMTLEIQTLDQNQAIVTFSNGEQHLYDLN